jgi:outer membrane protein assembly factor BamA
LDARVSDQTKNIITYSDENKKATLVFDIYEGPLISVSSVIVEGNFFTKDYIVLRELQFGVGETLTPEKISYSEVRLQRLALFDSIEIRTLTDDPNEGRRTVLVIVTEKKPGKFKGGLGADNELTLSLKGYVGAAYRNLFGTGRIINGRVEVSDKISNSWSFWEKEVTLGYTEPFALGTTNNLKLSGTYSNKLYSINSDSTAYLGQIVYALETIQGSLILERDLTRYLKLVYELYGIEKTKTYETMGRRPAIPIDIYTTGPTLILDKRDDVFNTKRGFMTSASTEYSSPALGSSDTVNYVKAVGDFSAYFPLGKTVLAQQVRSGYIWNLFMTSGTVIPQLKAFVLGGRSTIRGFNVTETVPRFSDLQNGLVSSNGAASYELFYLSKTEWRVPIVGNFGVAIFYDGGHIEYSNFTQNFFWRDSVGLGLRYNTPVGPVSIEYGYKLNRDLSRGETPGEFHFSIGVF